MLVIDRQTLHLLAANEAAAALYGFRSDELPALTALDIVARDEHAALLDDLQGRADRERHAWTHVTRGAGNVDVHVAAHDVLFDGRSACLAVVSVAPQRQRAHDEVGAALETNRRQTANDPLTGLPNRAGFRERLEELIDDEGDPHPLAVVFLGIDRFKEINDTLGHESGDELLCELATRLRLGFRADDTVARMGADEFALLLHGAGDPSELAGYSSLEHLGRLPLDQIKVDKSFVTSAAADQKN